MPSVFWKINNSRFQLVIGNSLYNDCAQFDLIDHSKDGDFVCSNINKEVAIETIKQLSETFDLDVQLTDDNYYVDVYWEIDNDAFYSSGVQWACEGETPGAIKNAASHYDAAKMRLSDIINPGRYSKLVVHHKGITKKFKIVAKTDYLLEEIS